VWLPIISASKTAEGRNGCSILWIGMVVVALFLAPGCAIRSGANVWKGRHVSELVASLGPPDQIVAAGNGEKIYVYDRTKSISETVSEKQVPPAGQPDVYAYVPPRTWAR